jgi:hypothetical protein
LSRIPQGSVFRACALGLLHKRHARKHSILSDFIWAKVYRFLCSDTYK